MRLAPPMSEVAQPTPDLQLLVELPSRTHVFFGNLRELVFPRRLPPLELRSAPAAFWPDVFVSRPVPWGKFLQSVVFHAVALTLLIGFTRFFALEPRVIEKPAFDRTQVVYYQPDEYLPPLDTRVEEATRPRQADPELSPQAIISLPREADNHKETIVTPPNVKLRQDVRIPNIVAWSDKLEKPTLAVPPVPLTPAAEISRIAPQMSAVVAPPPDASQMNRQRNSPMLQSSVVAPPPDVNAASASGFQAPEPAVVAPPPSVETASARLGQLNIAPSAVIAPAPQLAVADQRAVAGGGLRGRAGSVGGAQVVPPPPSSAGAGSDFGARGRVIALSLHPDVSAPPNPPAGNRRGAFAATPTGHAGASGAPGAAAGGVTGGTDSRGSGKEGGGTRKGTGDVPSGLYVGSAGARSSPVAGESGGTAAASPKVVAGARPPAATNVPARTVSSESKGKLSEAEREVFGDRKFYSLTLNMPNLNSAGGSWVIRFAELDKGGKDANEGVGDHPAAELSQPAATRKVDPAYPLQLMKENIAGTVILYAIIRADGSVANVRVIRGVDDRLDRYAREAVAKWQFSPAMKNGSPVDVEATFQIPFKPSKVGSNF